MYRYIYTEQITMPHLTTLTTWQTFVVLVITSLDAAVSYNILL